MDTCAGVSSEQVTVVPGLGECPGFLRRHVDPRGWGSGEEQRWPSHPPSQAP